MPKHIGAFIICRGDLPLTLLAPLTIHRLTNKRLTFVLENPTPHCVDFYTTSNRPSTYRPGCVGVADVARRALNARP